MDTLQSKASQSRTHSLFESIVNMAVGFVINFTIQYFVFAYLNAHVSLTENFALSVLYTIISIVRSYGLRRLFNYIHIRRLQ